MVLMVGRARSLRTGKLKALVSFAAYRGLPLLGRPRLAHKDGSANLPAMWFALPATVAVLLGVLLLIRTSA